MIGIRRGEDKYGALIGERRLIDRSHRLSDG